MKKIVFLSLFALCLPWMVSAQSIDDDLYYIPSKDKKEKKQEKKVTSSAPTEEIVVKSNAPTTVYTSPGNTTVVVQDRKGNTRDVDEYNRRYDSRENDFVMEDDTLYIKEKAVPDPDGEWVNGFDGSEDDYEYAMRIVRFRNPRYAVSISSPYYWDIVYGLNSWDWNVYTDGMYAYAFPTFSNRLWWDWRYNSYGWGGYPYYGWGGYSPYYSYGGWSYGWGGFYGGWSWGWGHHHHHYYPGGGWYPGGGGHWGGNHWGSRDTYTNRRYSGTRSTTTARRTDGTGRVTGATRQSTSGQVRRGESGTTRRVVGTRSSGERPGMSTRTDAASSRRSTYTRPSSTRSSSSYNSNVGNVRSGKYVTVVEIMGRNAGWLTAAAALAKSDDCEGVDMICLPEVPFNVEHFIEKVRVMQEKKPSIVIAVSEGVKLEDGRYVCELADDVHAVDAFGHKALTGTDRKSVV